MSQSTAIPAAQPKRLLVPKAPVLALDGCGFACLTPEGELGKITASEGRALVRSEMPVVCHAPQIAQRLGLESIVAFDVLELFAFVRPGKFCVPTPRGIARALDLFEPSAAEDECLSLRDAVRHLLVDLASEGREEKTDPAGLAAMMGESGAANGGGGWPWAPVVLGALGRSDPPPSRNEIRASLRVWDRLPEWAVHAPDPPPGHFGVSAEEAGERLHKLLARQKKEDRPQQQAYAKELAHAFSPANGESETSIIMAEAGTGTGKTLGYLAPATVWAEKNAGAVWISTFTRNLQRQIDTELEKLHDDPVAKARKIVTRKGRENYLCLLNLEDAGASQATTMNAANAVALGLLTRWAGVTEDGDLAGKDFPGWLRGLLGWNRVHNFADRRGECVYSGCAHFNKCFVEKSVRKAKRADIVIANHALVMQQAAGASPDDTLPSRYVFDEGHHLFEAADSAFDLQLNGQWTSDLRRWLLGGETSAHKSRARGIRRRVEDLIAENEEARRDLDDVIEAARCLPGPQWRQRIADDRPRGVTENFLSFCRKQVYARNKDPGGFYSLETQVAPAMSGLLESAYALSLRLRDLQRPMLGLAGRLQRKLVDDAETLDAETRERIRFTASGLQRRALNVVGAWITMLTDLGGGAEKNEFADWLEVTRVEGKDTDTGFYRYHVDPVKMFAEQLKPHAAGVVITSASLRDASPDDEEGWTTPALRSGLKELAGEHAPRFFHVASPFDYAAQTKILVVGDVDKKNTEEVAAAYRALFLAAGGGALGLFTAVQRLKAVHEKIAAELQEKGLPLFAQHVDPLDTGTLIDIFREEENACLLGTDAARDGVDVPGRSLRLVVYDRVPWPRPTLLHKARRAYFGRGYDDMLTRFKLKQAYGRLIRRSDDRGVFVMLDAALPTRLASAFPSGVEVQRLGLKEAIGIIKDFIR